MRVNDSRGAGDEKEASESGKRPASRRDFLATAAAGACIGGLGLATLGTLRATFPSVLPDPSQQFKIGPPADIPEGSVMNMEEENVIVFHDNGGFYAVSKICTHQGCVLDLETDGFSCPCHGSIFTLEGEIVRGPAPRALDWLEVTALPSGQLIVDRGRPVPQGTKLKVSG